MLAIIRSYCNARVAFLALVASAQADPAAAHAFGQRYDLPLPLWLYLLGAATAVAASFGFLALFRGNGRAPRRAVLARGTVSASLVALLRTLSVTLFAIMIVAGLFGNQNPFKNIAPVILWVLWWVGFAFFCAFVANLWPIVSPFAAIFEWADLLSRRFSGRSLVLGRRYPQQLGIWPAVVGFLLFAWIELMSPSRDSPRLIAAGALVYSLLTWAGCALYGPRVWLRRAEAFSVAFALLGRFAPIFVLRGKSCWTWCLRPWAVGLLGRQPIPASFVAFALIMLATVSVDGFLETPPWAAVIERLTPVAASPLAQPSPPLWPATMLLCLAPAAFAITYVGIIQVMAWLACRALPASYLAQRFVLTLIPIAIAYHLAHYLSFLLLAGQLAIPLASDPFGWGWDLFGTTLYRMDIGIIDARTVWFVSVAAIITGHVLATWLAHETALEIFPERRAARLSQIPMLALMVSYTVLSLWILAQPITETRP